MPADADMILMADIADYAMITLMLPYAIDCRHAMALLMLSLLLFRYAAATPCR